MTGDVPPLDPEQAKMQRILKIVVASLGIMILVILGIIVTTVLVRSGGDSEDRQAATQAPQRAGDIGVSSGLVTMPEGGRVTNMAMDEGVIALHVEASRGDSQIVIVDLATGAVRGRLKLVEP